MSKTQTFNSGLINNIRNLYINKAYEKNYPVVHFYNDEKKNLMLIHLLKIPRVNCNIIKSCDQSRDEPNQIGTISDHY